MSKLYQLNRMRYSAAAGGLFTGLVSAAGKFVGKILQSKATRAAIAAGKKVMANPLAQTAAVVGGAELAGALLNPGAKKNGGGAGGGWTGRRRKGITATELRGFRKVAKLLHKEGMTIKKHRRG